MNIGAMKALEAYQTAAGVKTQSAGSDVSFAGVLKSALHELNDSQIRADETVKSFLAGETQDVHQVMIALQEARLTMQLGIEVRNKLVEAYQEISRMQI